MSAETANGFIRGSCRMGSFASSRRIRSVMIWLLTGVLTMTNGYGIEFGDREAVMWRCEEWTLENASWSGNPFDVIAEVTFAHSPTGATP